MTKMRQTTMTTTVFLLLSLMMMMMMTRVVDAAKPSGCSESSGVYTCDYRFVVPMAATDFDPPPQRLILEEVDGTLAATDLTAFANVDQTLFDINYAAQLTIICITGGGGVVTLDSTSFTDMEFYDEIRIINCGFTSIPASAFSRLGSVNHFSLEGGTVDSIDADALLGLNVIRDASLPVPRGSFAMIDVTVVPAGLPQGFFSNMSEAREIILSNCNLFSIDLDLFSAAALVTSINLDHNTFTTLPDNAFKSITALGTVSMAAIAWECSCNDLWFIDYFNENSILLTSAVTCTLPSTYFGKTAHNYYGDICDTGLKCDGGGMPAVDLGGVTCLTVLQIVIYVFAIIGFFGGMAALAIAIHTKRQVGGAGGAGGPARPGGGGPKRGAGNRISQRPPNGTRPPVKRNAFAK